MGKVRHRKPETKPNESDKSIVQIDAEGEELMDENNDDENDLNEQQDIDFDKRSVISSKTVKALVSKKKDKIKLKRQLFLKRLHSAHEAKREAKERAERRKTVIVSDMKHEFENSLSQIESYLEEQRLAINKKKHTRKQIPTQAERNQQCQTNVDIFKKISQSIEHATNPFDIIKKQLEQQVAMSENQKRR